MRTAHLEVPRPITQLVATSRTFSYYGETQTETTLFALDGEGTLWCRTLPDGAWHRDEPLPPIRLDADGRRLDAEASAAGLGAAIDADAA